MTRKKQNERKTTVKCVKCFVNLLQDLECREAKNKNDEIHVSLSFCSFFNLVAGMIFSQKNFQKTQRAFFEQNKPSKYNFWKTTDANKFKPKQNKKVVLLFVCFQNDSRYKSSICQKMIYFEIIARRH